IDKKQLGRELQVPPGGEQDAEDGDLVTVEVLRQRVFGLPTARVKEKLGSLKSEKAVSLIAIHAHAIPHVFPEAVLGEAVAQGLASDAAVAASVAQARALWALREDISEAQRIEGVSIKHDVSVPVSRIPEFLERAGAALAARWPDIRVVAFGHIGDGNLHYNLSKAVADANATFIARTAEVNGIVHDLVCELGGSISAEHGLGQLKREEVLRYKPALEMELMRRVKQAFDPAGLMNPGKVL
ncbi:MAG TPA: FAD-linked oxidase C-terminal domain-containing protein, partial [Thauera aminoaromatica]|nr:FAD-linked oxidase C-terminal domain-containing protein [Thauera aminoaromatica]